MINQVLDQRYEVVEKLGESTFFAVYRARDRAAQRQVLLKQLQPAWQQDAALISGLQEGMAAAAALKHPNIAEFTGWLNTPNGPCLVTEYVRGMDLKERIRRLAPYNLAVAIDICCSLAEALVYAHTHRQVHGDVRPHNVIITAEGAVKLTDLGQMRGICQSRKAQIALLQRSAPYHAPELSTTEPGSAAGDIYALGATLYEMLTGSQLYNADTPEAIADLHINTPIPSPRLINQGVPRSVEGIVIKCLQKKPEQRYASAAELLTDLKSARDALRFGKSLSWSPMDLEKLPAETVARPTFVASPPPPREPAAVTRQSPMSPTNRLRAREQRVSSFITGAIGALTFLILAIVAGFYIVYRLNFVQPPAENLPSMVGMQVEQAQALASQKHIRLLLHGSYMNKPRDVIYQTDQDTSLPAHPGQYINAWYSKGPMYVQVPDLTGMTKEGARQALQHANLVLGKTTPEYSGTVPIDEVISQDVSSKKSVLHGTAVDLLISDGPQPDTAAANSPLNPADSSQNPPASNGSSSSTNTSNNTGSTGTQPAAGSGGATAPAPGSSGTAAPAAGDAGTSAASAAAHAATHTFNFPITLRPTANSGPGPWQVRITYTDSTGTHEVMNASQSDGDKVPVSFTYTGSSIRLRIYYNGSLAYDHRLSPQTMQQGGKP